MTTRDKEEAMSNGCVRGYNSVTLNGDEIVLQDAGFTVRTRKSDMSIDSIEAIVADWLTAHGYDGLKSNWDECRCGLENLMHCEDKYDCKPAYRQGEEAMSDNEERLERVMDEAERFIEAAGKVLENPPEYDFQGNKHTAAAKRASLDLTRALADYRGRNR